MQTRRHFLKNGTLGLGLLTTFPDFLKSGLAKKKIVLRSGWQTVNIGDIAHTPGVLHLLEKYVPEAEVRLWANTLDNGAKEIIQKRFPNLEIFTGSDTEAVARAFKECDFLLHGSGPSLVAKTDVARWSKETGKPYGIYGITYSDKSPEGIELLTKADFAFFRDTVSLDFAKSNGAASKIMEFGPDGAFATDILNDTAAKIFLEEHGLKKGKFMCVIPKYRNTPYWLIPSKNTPFNAERDARNQAMKEHDHKPLRDAIIAVVQQTDLKILIVPEDQTQVAIGKEMLYDPLPDNIKSKVVWRDRYWLTDEALSTYKLSAGIFGNEQHSPIMCIGHGIPAIVCRFKEQTSKGIMWRDIGLGEWLFDHDVEEEAQKIAPTVLWVAKNPKKAQQKVAEAQKIVVGRQKATMAIVKQSLAKV
jgi:polysaccharide pyruvyl transferase WcaK-like protein